MNTGCSPGSRKPSSFWWSRWSNTFSARVLNFRKNLLCPSNSRGRDEKSGHQIIAGDVNMRTSIKPRLWMPLLLCLSMLNIAPPLAHCADLADKREIIKKARAAYYSLRSHGLDEFEASAQPNWRLVLKDQLAKDPASAEEGLKMLNGIHFRVSLGRDGAVKITQHEDVAPINPQ